MCVWSIAEDVYRPVRVFFFFSLWASSLWMRIPVFFCLLMRNFLPRNTNVDADLPGEEKNLDGLVSMKNIALLKI